MPHAKGKLKPGETMKEYQARARSIHMGPKAKKKRRAAVAKVRAGY